MKLDDLVSQPSSQASELGKRGHLLQPLQARVPPPSSGGDWAAARTAWWDVLTAECLRGGGKLLSPGSGCTQTLNARGCVGTECVLLNVCALGTWLSNRVCTTCQVLEGETGLSSDGFTASPSPRHC